MASDETKRIKELMREREQGDGNMDWMYKKSKPDTEEYLLGRKLDKALEEEEEPPENKNDAGAIFTERVKANIAMDMAAKMREDPLFQIKKREEDAKKKLLQNPVRMKQLQKLVKEKEKKHKKKKKKLKKKKSRSSDDESDAEDDIMKKYLAVLSKKHKPGKLETPGDEKPKHKHKGDNKDGHGGRKHSMNSNSSPEKTIHSSRQYRARRNSSSSEDNKRSGKPYGLLLRGEDSKQKHSTNSSSSRSRSPRKGSRSPRKRSRSSGDERSPVRRKSPKRKHSLVNRSPSKNTLPKRKRSRSRSPHGNTNRSNRKHSSRSPVPERNRRRSRSTSPNQKTTKRKLTDEEKRRKLEEMQENARWRDDQREKNVSRYRKEAEDEEISHRSKGSSSDFLNPLMAGHVSQSSVQDRIKRNIYNVQRTKADLDKDFTRR